MADCVHLTIAQFADIIVTKCTNLSVTMIHASCILNARDVNPIFIQGDYIHINYTIYNVSGNFTLIIFIEIIHINT